MSRIISPSFLSADFSDLDKDIEMLNGSKAEWFHLDIMDGVFVPNISFGFPVIEAIRKKTDKVLDAHLMIIRCLTVSLSSCVGSAGSNNGLHMRTNRK